MAFLQPHIHSGVKRALVVVVFGGIHASLIRVE
jgi:hypothetical protein